MRTYLWIGAVVALGLCGCAGEQEVTKPEFVQYMESGGPATIGKIRRVTHGPAIGEDWDEVPIAGLTSRFFNGQENIYARVVVERRNSNPSQQSLFDSRQYYWDKNKLYQQTEPNSKGWLWLPETTGQPMGFRFGSSSSHKPLPIMLKVDKGTIIDVPVASKSTDYGIRLEYIDGKITETKIVSPATKRPLADVPNLPAPLNNFKPKTNEDYFSIMEDVRKVNGNYVVGSIRSNPRREKADYSWRIRPIAGGKWKIISKPIIVDYLNEILPEFLRGSYVPTLRDYNIKVWKDGGLIFTMHTYRQIKSQNTLINANLLILQPLNGKPRLLNWNFHYLHQPKVDVDNIPSDQVTVDTSWSKDWALIGEKTVSSNPSDISLENGVLFDVDGANDSIIYLQGGQLWAIDMSKAHY